MFDQDVVIVVRCPDEEAIRSMRPGSILVTMLHFPTRPGRIQLLDEVGLDALSLDSVVDDTGHRLVENLESVGWNGVEAAFRELARIHPNFSHPSRRPLRVTCLGAGAVGGHAVRAATRYGDMRLREEMVARNVPGVEVTVVDFDLTWHEDYMLGRLERTDLLIDATGRLDTSVPVIPNAWLAALPEEAVILDLSSDPYLPEAEPPMVKGIEGVPQGDLDGYVFPVDHPAWDAQPPSVDTTNRRLALSCYAWPGIHPRRCMEVYGSQIEPLMTLVLTAPIEAVGRTQRTARHACGRERSARTMADDGRRMTIGFPRMRKEPGERRDFLPSLIARLALHDVEIVIEHGVGGGMGLSDDDYTAIGPSVRITSHEEAFEQDIVVVLRCPDPEELDLLRAGTALVSMLHFPTRPERIARLRRAGVDAIALDCIADDAGNRLVEDSRAVAMERARGRVRRARAHLSRSSPTRSGPPIRVTVMGAGAIGRHAVEAATKYGRTDRAARLFAGRRARASRWSRSGGTSRTTRATSRSGCA